MRRTARGLLAGGLAAACLGLFAMPASAHVTVSPGSATQGGYSTLTFKVPTERDDASTTKIEVDFPAEHPLPGASYQPKPGWKITVAKEALATPITAEDGDQITDRVTSITWEAINEESRIGPGQFDTFPISVGPLPTDTDTMVFKALQTYSSGEIVRWIEEAAEGSTEEPKNPAPTVKLAPAAAVPTTSAAPVDTAAIDSVKATADEAKATALEARTAAAEVADGPSSDQVNVAVGLGIGGIVLALIAGGIAGMALGRRSGGAGGSAGPPPAF